MSKRPKRRDPLDFTDEDYLKYGHDPVQGIVKAAIREELTRLDELARDRHLREARRRTPRPALTRQRLH